jgi:hypothetical protein
MKFTFRGILLSSAIVILVFGIIDIFQLIIIKNKGAEIKARVINVDIDCDRYNKIDVEFENRIYEVSISRSDCKNKTYSIGQQVTLLKYKNKKKLVWPDSNYNWLPLIVGFVLFLGYYTTKNKFGESK